MESYVLPDTNILLEDLNIVEKLIDKKYYVVIPVTVIDELDNLKLKRGLAYKAREIGRVIEKILNRKSKYLILTNNLKEEPSLKLKKEDDRILYGALFLIEKGKKVILLSKDRFV